MISLSRCLSGLFFMINFNGTLVENAQLALENRGYTWGDALFETLKVVNSKILFWEDHYFRLMASMRILRMEIPMTFTMEFLEQQILNTIEANNLSSSAVKVRFNVDRGEGGNSLPITKTISYYIETEALEANSYTFFETSNTYTVDLYKDFFVAPGLLSTLNTNNRIMNVLGSIYAKENDLENCLLLNTDKNVIGALTGNVFLVNANKVKTPPLLDGCINGIMRKQVLELIKTTEDYEIEEASVSVFELQKADEVFITNVVQGIQPVLTYRKKTYGTKVSQDVVQRLNAKLQLD